MLNKYACQLGTNLATMLYEQKKDITPVAGTLMQQLCESSYTALPPSDSGGPVFDIVSHLHASGLGVYSPLKEGQSRYNLSRHDALMDDYIVNIGKLVANHVQYARATVYPKIQYLSEQIDLALKQHELQQPEDFFDVKMYRLPEVFDTELMQNEVLGFTPSSASCHVINFGEATTLGLDFGEYIKTGEAEQDTLIASWLSTTDESVAFGYVFSGGQNLSAAEPVFAQINAAFANFLFYRSLAIRQDMGLGLSVTQLVSRASDNRDFYAQCLRSVIENYKSQIKQGAVLMPTSQVNFSYLGNQRFEVHLYEENASKAFEAGATIEHVFGFIAQTSSPDLTVEMLQNDAEKLASAWRNVRTLYLTHITSRRDVALKMALKTKVCEALYLDLSEEEKAFFAENKGFEEETAQMVNTYVQNLDVYNLEHVQDILIDLVAGIGHRHSSAARIIREMKQVMELDDTVEPGQAALHAVVKYVTDFLIEELSVTS